MSSAEQWSEALRQNAGQPFTLHFDRLGLTANCRPLLSGEVEECRRIGGERGLRYALYLSCEELQKAGEQLRLAGEIASPFEITERIGYGDTAAAGAAVLRRSSIRTAGVSVETQPGVRESADPPEAFDMEALLGTAQKEDFADERAGAFSFDPDEKIARELADRLWMAAGNR